MGSRYLLVIVLLAGCGEPPVTPDGGLADCPTNDQPTYELGTGDAAFEPLVDGQDLTFAPGPQGGCHFWLGVRTAGFPRRGTKLRYEVVYADTGTTTMSFSSFALGLEPVDGDPDRCEAYGVTAFLIKPWTFEDRSVRIETRVWFEPTTGTEVAATASRTVFARWPEGGDENACGLR